MQVIIQSRARTNSSGGQLFSNICIALDFILRLNMRLLLKNHWISLIVLAFVSLVAFRILKSSSNYREEEKSATGLRSQKRLKSAVYHPDSDCIDFSPRDDGSDPILTAIFGAAKIDIQQGYQKILESVMTPKQSRYRTYLGYSVLSLQISRASEVLALHPSLFEQQAVLAQVIPGALTQDRDKTIAVIELLDKQLRDSAYYYIIRFDLERGVYRSAILNLAKMSDLELRGYEIGEIARQTAPTDLDLAINWIDGLKFEGEQHIARMGVIDALVDAGNISGLLRLLPILADVNERAVVLKNATLISIKDGSSSSFYEKVQKLSAADQDVVNSIRLAYDDGAPFDERLNQVEQISDRKLRNIALAQVMNNEIAKGFEKAVASVPAIPDKHKLQFVSLLAARWIKENRNDAFAWIKSMPDGGERDAAVSAVSMSLRFSDAETARDVATWTKNPVLRSKLESNIRK